MSQSDPCVVVRVAIALTILKYKPRDRSTASYLLDLQSHFPVATKDDDTRDWRTYALQLEKQLAMLKAQRDADQELLSKLPTDASASDAPPPKKKSKKNPSREQHDLEWTWDQTRADWSRTLSSQYPSSPSLVAAYASLKGALAAPNADLLAYAARLSDAILRALGTIHIFLFSPYNPNPDAQTPVAIGAPSQFKLEHIDSACVALASPLLMYVLRTALHTLVRTAQDITTSKRPRQRPRTTTPSPATDAYASIDKALDHLLEVVLLPLVRAITPLCLARLAPLLTVPPKSRRAVGKGKDKDKTQRTSIVTPDPPTKTSADVRADVFALIGTSLTALDALPPLGRPTSSVRVGDGGSIASSVRDRLGLETLRELEALYAVPPSAAVPPNAPYPPTTPSGPPLLPPPSSSHPRPRTNPSRAQRLETLAGTRAERVHTLATRDAGWYLASTLSVCVAGPHTTGGVGVGVGGRALRDALLDRIGGLVRSVPISVCLSDGDPQAHTDKVSCHAVDAHALGSDPVCQNMLLVICERAMSHLVSP